VVNYSNIVNKNTLNRNTVPEAFVALLMQIPLTTGLPDIPSNLMRITPSSLTDTLESTNCRGLLAPTIA